jgi:hypothetical protein
MIFLNKKLVNVSADDLDTEVYSFQGAAVNAVYLIAWGEISDI